MNQERALVTYETQYDQEQQQNSDVRDIHAVTPPPSHGGRRQESWETTSHISSLSTTSSNENFTTMSREFNALVMAGIAAENNLPAIGEDHAPPPTAESGHHDNNPLAIVVDNNYGNPSNDVVSLSTSSNGNRGVINEVPNFERVKREEVESKILAWQNAKIAKINNRFKREDAVINGWESEQVQKSTSWMKKIERKLEERRARALEKMENEIAKAHRKAEEKKASAEAKRGTKVSRVLEISNLMKAVGRPPVKRSFF